MSSEDDEDSELEKRELPYLYEKELIEKQNKRIFLGDEFIPTIKVSPMTSKFHAKHDQDPIIEESKYRKYLEVAGRFLGRPKERIDDLPIESQRYGWIPETLNNKNIFEVNTLRMCKNRCDLTIFGEKVSCEKVTQRPALNGLRFFVK